MIGRLCTLFLLTALLSCAPQKQGTGVGVRVHVTAPGKRPVARAVVTLLDDQAAPQRPIAADDEGCASVTGYAPTGNRFIQLRVTAPGFKPLETMLPLGQVRALEVMLAPEKSVAASGARAVTDAALPCAMMAGVPVAPETR